MRDFIPYNRLVKESNIPNLPYLGDVIKGTLRPHTSAPLIMKECADDCMENAYVVKGKSQVLVNVYAIMRDPDVWRDPEQSIPETFVEHGQMELKGQNFKYNPFRSGRRGCPGASLAMLVVQPAVANLVELFDWKVKDSNMVDMRQIGSGFAVEMGKPLFVTLPCTYHRN